MFVPISPMSLHSDFEATLTKVRWMSAAVEASSPPSQEHSPHPPCSRLLHQQKKDTVWSLAKGVAAESRGQGRHHRMTDISLHRNPGSSGKDHGVGREMGQVVASGGIPRSHCCQGRVLTQVTAVLGAPCISQVRPPPHFPPSENCLSRQTLWTYSHHRCHRIRWVGPPRADLSWVVKVPGQGNQHLQQWPLQGIAKNSVCSGIAVTAKCQPATWLRCQRNLDHRDTRG